jgi:hypothetical protein
MHFRIIIILRGEEGRKKKRYRMKLREINEQNTRKGDERLKKS